MASGAEYWILECVSCSNINSDTTCVHCDTNDTNIAEFFSGLIVRRNNSSSVTKLSVGATFKYEDNMLILGGLAINTDVKLMLVSGSTETITNDFDTIINFVKNCICPASAGDVATEMLIRVTPADPFDSADPVLDCSLYTAPTTLYLGGTPFNPDFIWRVLLDDVGDCVIVTIKSPNNPNVN